MKDVSNSIKETSGNSHKGLLPELSSCSIAVIGLGYVGLPLAIEFARSKVDARTGILQNRKVIGFDIDSGRVSELRQGIDRTLETLPDDLKALDSLTLSDQLADLRQADVFIVTVPTPLDSANRPDLGPLERASKMVGQALLVRAKHVHTAPVVIFESTVFPGATEEICVPQIERESGLTFNSNVPGMGFFCGYSPERINPGDIDHRLTSIVKITSGSTTEAGVWIDSLYGSIIKAGTHCAPSIKVAEAAKVIENTQRDLNIALVNELALIFARIGIDTNDVLDAARTKWNFLPFKPGLVGGHCIGVDPLYLTHKAEQLGYYPQVVLAGRRINDGMASWLSQRLLQAMARKGMVISEAKLLMLGLTFKENCPDLRNTRVLDLIHELRLCGITVTVVDPWVNTSIVHFHEDIEVLSEVPVGTKYSAVVAAVAHRQFLGWSPKRWRGLLNQNSVLMDLKGILPRELEPIRL